MEACQNEGRIRNLGLSNFNESQILKIIKACTVKPQVLQVELHAYFQQLDLRKFCSEHDIVVTAYAPLGSPGAKDHFVNKYNYRSVLMLIYLFLYLLIHFFSKSNKIFFLVLIHFRTCWDIQK